MKKDNSIISSLQHAQEQSPPSQMWELSEAKTCEQCQQPFPQIQFANQKNKTVLFPWCRGCRRGNPQAWRKRYHQWYYRLRDKEACKEARRRYRERHREHIRAVERKYRETHKESIQSRDKRQRQQNKVSIQEYRRHNQERIRQYNKAYYQKYKEKIKENTRAYQASNREKINDYQRRYYHQGKINAKRAFLKEGREEHV